MLLELQAPGPTRAGEIARFIPSDLLGLYEVHSYRHAASILANAHAEILAEIFGALRSFRLTTADLKAVGGNESGIVKRVTDLLRPHGWKETRISADLRVKKQAKAEPPEEMTIKNFIDGHKVDFVKGRVAFDMEWNSKDQTYDRDLFAFRAFYECNLISAAVLLTRSEGMNTIFRKLQISAKYGASTTWMGKLLYRLNAGRNGGCPVLVFGITPDLVTDWKAQ
jgi:CRISPR-associated protein Csd2